MKAKILVESARAVLVERGELITNWLAILALLAVGVVFSP
jgi:phage baseplate assembly protein gpV